MRKLHFALLFVFVLSTNAEYIWNGSDWIWKDEKKVETSEGESGDDYVPEPDTEGSGSIYVEERPKPPKQHQPKQEVTSPPRVQEPPEPKRPDDIFVDSENHLDVPSSTFPTVEEKTRSGSFFSQPGTLAAIVGGAIVGLLCAILCVMFIVYRMRKKDEGSYSLDEPTRSSTGNAYTKAPSREFYA